MMMNKSKRSRDYLKFKDELFAKEYVDSFYYKVLKFQQLMEKTQ